MGRAFIGYPESKSKSKSKFKNENVYGSAIIIERATYQETVHNVCKVLLIERTHSAHLLLCNVYCVLYMRMYMQSAFAYPFSAE